jgi:hypothetical protein
VVREQVLHHTLSPVAFVEDTWAKATAGAQLFPLACWRFLRKNSTCHFSTTGAVRRRY